MIIEKKYSFDKVPDDGHYTKYMTLKDYHRKILENIIKTSYEVQESTSLQGVIFVGLEGASMIQDAGGFSFNNISKSSNGRYYAPIGYLMGKDIYYDLRLEWDRVIFGTSISEINAHIITKVRKEKLKKINASETSTIS